MVLEVDSKALQDTEGKQQKQKQSLHMSWGSVAVVRHVGNQENKSLRHRFCAGLELHFEKLQKMKEHTFPRGPPYVYLVATLLLFQSI